MKNTLIIILLFTIVFTSFSQKKNKKDVKPVETSSLKNFDGYFNFSYEEDQDRIILKVDKLDEEFLYVSALSAGIGSNDIGLDRGQLGGERVVKFTKAGNKLLLVQPNYKFRAISDNIDEKKSVEEAFAKSILFGFPILNNSNGIYEIDLSDFLIRDVHDVSGTLKYRKQGNYSLDKSRSAFNMSTTKNFPLNSEFDVTLTFGGEPTGNYIRSVTPDANSITVRQHHSFVKLPDNNYKPRVFDPRAGYFPMSYMDYATPIDEPIVKRLIYRHRLEKKNPELEMSEAKEPIIYYLDRGAPEPIRSALIDGAQWWNQAFETAGFKNAFQVKLLPEGADPLDVRYNVIQWVHRSTRGWSYGSSVSDPRTGEIIKGHVSLGSLRVRQDFLIAEGLLAPYENGTEVPVEMEKMALARIRQLSAHEVGHTIGLAHSYTSSTEGRASVMDYPHPLASLKSGKIILDDAYDDKIGAWDKVAINYGYRQFDSPNSESKGLQEIVAKSLTDGLTFLSDQDARPQGGAHAYAHLWDNGKTAYDELNRVMEVRKVALANFGEKNIRINIPYATLEEVLVPIYFFHRYQVEAAVKFIGGLNYRYALRGDGQLITELIDPEEQNKAFDAIMNTIRPESLTLSEALIQKIPPRPIGYYRSSELTELRTGITFDLLGAAETATEMTLKLLLNPARMSRLVEYKARNAKQPGLNVYIDKLLNHTWKSKTADGIIAETQRTINDVVLSQLISLASSISASAQVKAIIQLQLDQLKKWLITRSNTSNLDQKAHFEMAINRIRLFQNDPSSKQEVKSLSIPAGSPIGLDKYCGFHSGKK